MESRSTQRARPIQVNEGGHDAMKGFAYLAKSSVTIEEFSGARHRLKHEAWRVAARKLVNFAIGTSLVLLSSLLAMLLTQSLAAAGDFSSQTVNPRASYSGVRLQQGNPQLDSDRKPNPAGSSVKIEPHIGSPGVQQGMSLRGIDGVNARRGNNSIILCGTNCRK
jgi:hypothetical protein